MSSSAPSRVALQLSVAVALLAFAAQRLDATSYLISTTADGAVNDGNCTLREALRAADTDTAVDACPAGGAADTITLPAGTYLFSGQEQLIGSGSLTLQSQTLDPLSVSIDLNNVGRFLELGGSASYVLGGLEIRNGRVPSGDPVGGAIFAFDVDLRIFNFRFVSNSVAGIGGALFYNSLSAPEGLLVENGTFLSNSVTAPVSIGAQGGAAHAFVNNGATAEFRDVSFVGNSATDLTNSVGGGALSLQTNMSGSMARCVRCIFQSNSGVSTDPAGSGAVWGGALLAGASGGGRIEVVDSRFTANSASGGAGVFKSAALRGDTSSGASLLLERLFFDINTAPADPLSHDVELRNDGAASFTEFYDSQLTSGTGSGLLVVTDSAVLLGHLTIADYPGVGLRSAADPATGEISLQNSIVVLNDGGDLYAEPLSAPVLHTTNFIGGDPQFLDEPNGNYHLSAASTAIGAGTNGAPSVRFADLDHGARIVAGTTDLGCYEFDGLFADNFEVGDAGSWSLIVP